jgi:hypothetical protein
MPLGPNRAPGLASQIWQKGRIPIGSAGIEWGTEYSNVELFISVSPKTFAIRDSAKCCNAREHTVSLYAY